MPPKQRRKKDATVRPSAGSILGLFALGIFAFTLVVLVAVVFRGGSGKRARINSYYINGTRATELVKLAQKQAPRGDLEGAALVAAELESKRVIASGRGVLCATFTSTTPETLSLLFSNMKQTGSHCDWAVVFYNSQDPALLREFRQNVTTQLISKIVLFEDAMERATLLASFPSIASSLNLLSKEKRGSREREESVQRRGIGKYNTLAYPKPLLYLHLLPLLSTYERIWLLDDDVGLDESFDLAKFLYICDCAFWPDRPPLVMQPLINPVNKGYAFLGVRGWAIEDVSMSVTASATGFIELQAPLMDTAFLSWFLRFVVAPMVPPLHILGADWGFDDLFCPAAAKYDKAVASPAKALRNVTCAVIVANGKLSVRHLDRKVLDTAIGKGVKWHLNHAMLELVSRTFPTFFHKGFRSTSANPFNSTVLTRAKGELSGDCFKERQRPS